MAPSLSHFPSPCLETIFKHVPLNDLFRSIGLVCQSWYKSRYTELMRRRRLVIVGDEELLEQPYDYTINSFHETGLIQHVRRDDGSPWLSLETPYQIKFYSLTIPVGMFGISSSTSSLAFLSKITHLTLMFDRVTKSASTQIVRFIEYYSEHLVELKLHIETIPRTFGHIETAVEFVNNLFACLDRLLSLRHLRLSLTLFQDLPIRPQLTFLSRLITLAIDVHGFEDEIGWIFSSLRDYGTNIESIELYNCVELTDLLEISTQLDDKFNVLSVLELSIEDYDGLRRFCSRFNSLTNLWLFEPSMPLTMLARCLALLPQLVHLDLGPFDLIPPTEGEQPAEQPQQVSQVPSVRLLTLHITTEFSHLESERLFIPEIFPNLQVLRLEHYIRQCVDCEITTPIHGECHHIRNAEPELARQLTECTRLTREPFRRCANLHTIQLVNLYVKTLINFDEL